MSDTITILALIEQEIVRAEPASHRAEVLEALREYYEAKVGQPADSRPPDMLPDQSRASTS